MSKTEIRFQGIFTTDEIKIIYSFVDKDDFSEKTISDFIRNRPFSIIKEEEEYVTVLK